MRWCFSCLIWLCLTAGAWAQQSGDLEALTRAEQAAREKEQQLAQQRQAVLAEINDLKTRLQADTAQTQAFERESLRLTDQLSKLDDRVAALTGDLSENRASTQDLLAALQRLQMAPNALSIADPDDAVRTAQAARMIETLSSELQNRAREILRLSTELTESRVQADARRVELSANLRELNRRRDRTAALVTEKETLQASIADEEWAARTEADRLAAESQTLRELLERVSEKAAAIKPRLKPGVPATGPVTLPDGTAPFAAAKGAVIAPVAGRLLKAFGRGERGQTYVAPSEGQVVAPYAGRVEFAGPFKTYGRVVILNMDDGYFLLLTGLGQTFVAVGEMVDRGEPVGIMPASRIQPSLYLELRKDSRTIDPAPWLQ